MSDVSGWFDQTAMPEKARQDAEDCGRLVEFTRMEEGWDRPRLATAAGVRESAVEDFEAGRVHPVEPMLSTLLRAMGRTN